MQEATADVGGAPEAQHSNTQVTVALIGAVATIVTAVTGVLVARGGDGGTARPPTPISKQQLTGLARTLTDENAKECTDDAPESPVNDWVTITSPSPQAEVAENVPMKGTIRPRSGDELYVFSYAPSPLCFYYFNPELPVPTKDGAWTSRATLVDSEGATIGLIAAVVDPTTAAALNEVIEKAESDGHDPYLVKLPPNTQYARVSVRVRTSS